MRKVKIGLDLGVSSVGWAVINQDNQIIDGGVDLFENTDNGNDTPNKVRREFRSVRRQNRRRKYRLQQFAQYLIDIKFISDLECLKDEKTWQYRKNGFEQKLTNEQIANVLYSGLKKRGVRLDLFDKESDYSSILNSTSEQIQNFESIAHYVINLLQEGKKLRNGENVFYHSDVVRDFENFFEKQKTFTPEITEINDKFFELLKQKREYYQGPNKTTNENQNSEFYLKFRTIDGETNSNIWMESLIGKDKYNDELRASKSSVFMEYVYTFDKLNNLKINNKLLTIEEKNMLFNLAHAKKGNVTFKQIKKILNLGEDTNFNYNFEKDTEKFIELKNQTKIRLIFNKFDKSLFQVWMEEFDQCLQNDVSQIKNTKIERLTSNLQITKDENGIRNLLNELEIPQAFEIFKEKITNFSGSYNLSIQTGINIYNDVVNNSKNVIQALTLQNIHKNKKYSKLEFLTKDEVPNPVVRKSLNKSIQRIKYLEKKYDVEYYVVELARDFDQIGSSKQAKDKKKRYISIQKKNEIERKHAIQWLEQNNYKSNSANILKYRLFKEQKGCDAYTGESLDLKDIFENASLFEVDHIIPFSISFNDSQSNKVLTSKVNNNSGTGKGNKTPYMWLMNSNPDLYNKLKVQWLDWYKGDKYSKFKNLTFEGDISKNSVKGEFINRNLSDTRYITRELMNLINSFKQEEENTNKVYAFPTTGQFVSLLRKAWYQDHLKDIISTDKREDVRHHFLDAVLIALTRNVNFLSIAKSNNRNILDYLRNYTWSDENNIIHKETGVVISREEINKDLKEIYEKIDFSKKNIECPISNLADQVLNKWRKIIPNKSEVKKLNNELWDTQPLKMGKENTKYENHKIKTVTLDNLEYGKLDKLIVQPENDTYKQIHAIFAVQKDYFKKYNGKLFMNPKQTLEYIKNNPLTVNDYEYYYEEYIKNGIKLKSNNLNTPEIKKIKFDGGKATVWKKDNKNWTGLRAYGLEIYQDVNTKKIHGRELKRTYFKNILNIEEGFIPEYVGMYLNKKGKFEKIPSSWKYMFTLYPNSKVEFEYSDGKSYKGFYAKYKFNDATISLNDYFVNEQISKSFGKIVKITKLI